MSPVIGADTIPAKKVNRKANGIKGLANYPYVSASFPTVTFGNKNKTTPNSATRINSYSGRVMQVGIDSGFRSVG